MPLIPASDGGDGPGAVRLPAHRRVLGVLGATLALAYPFCAYVGLSRLGTRRLGAALAALLLVSLLFRLRGMNREHALVAARVPGIVVALLLVGSLFDDRRFVLALPVVTNVVLLVHFATSLKTIPVAERFARAMEDLLSPAQIAYCRTVTIVWCVFFLANGAVTAILALFAPLSWWTAYAGGVSYVLVGLLVAVEYLVRKKKFRKYGASPIDRLIARVFPSPRDGTPAEGGVVGLDERGLVERDGTPAEGGVVKRQVRQ
jgi:uncharacterized membrane protein